MAVTRDDVKHVATLARLAMTDDRAEVLTAELNSILRHMEVLDRVDTKKLEPVVGVGAESAPVAADHGPSVELENGLETFAPSVRDGFMTVPRLASHETAGES